MYEQIIETRAHRKGYIPKGPWLLSQQWNDLLFMHLPVSPSDLKKHIPPGVELDTYDDVAWISIVPFHVREMHFRYLPPIPLLCNFFEINVRTYVKRNDKAGVYFFSLDANHLPTVIGARIVSLPYYDATIRMSKKNNRLNFYSKRIASPQTEFEGLYKASSPTYYSKDTSLEYWLLGRYYLWSYRNNTLYEGEIHHKPWKISGAEVLLQTQNMLPPFFDETVIGPPLFHYATVKRVLFWSIHSVDHSHE